MKYIRLNLAQAKHILNELEHADDMRCPDTDNSEDDQEVRQNFIRNLRKLVGQLEGEQ